MSTDQQQLADTFVCLADTLVDDFDLLGFLGLLAEKASQHLDVAAAGVILTDQRGGWRPTATSEETPQLVELFSAQTLEGPCRECVRTGARVSSPDLADEDQRWPTFAHQAVQAGYLAAVAVPMRSRCRVIGSLTLFNTTSAGVDEMSLQLGQSLADMATIGLLQQYPADRGDLLAEQLQAVLHHRVVLEQAKGTLAEHGRITPAQGLRAAAGLRPQPGPAPVRARPPNRRNHRPARSRHDGRGRPRPYPPCSVTGQQFGVRVTGRVVAWLETVIGADIRGRVRVIATE